MGIPLIETDSANIRTYGAIPADRGSAAANVTRIAAMLVNAHNRSLKIPIRVPAGDFFINSNLPFPTCTGVRVNGNGLGAQYSGSGDGVQQGPVSRFIWNGTGYNAASAKAYLLGTGGTSTDVGGTDNCMFRLPGFGTVLDGMFLQGVDIPNGSAFNYTETDRVLVGILIEARDGATNNQAPSGKVVMPVLSQCAMKIGVYASIFPDGVHADNIVIGYFEQIGVDIGLQCDCEQALTFTVNHHEYTPLGFTVPTSYRNAVAYNFLNGGCLNVNSFQLDNYGVILQIGESSSHTGRFKIQNLIVDGTVSNEAHFEMVRMLKPRLASVRMDGSVHRGAGSENPRWCYTRPIVVPMGGGYDIRLEIDNIDYYTRQAFPAEGIKPDDPIISAVPPTDSHLKFWLSATDRTTLVRSSAQAADESLVDTVSDKGAFAATMTALSGLEPTINAGDQPDLTYTYSGMHRRPALNFYGGKNLQRSAANSVEFSNTPGLTVIAIIRPSILVNNDTYSVVACCDTNIPAGTDNSWGLFLNGIAADGFSNQRGHASLVVGRTGANLTTVTTANPVINDQPTLLIGRYNSGTGLLEVETNGSGIVAPYNGVGSMSTATRTGAGNTPVIAGNFTRFGICGQWNGSSMVGGMYGYVGDVAFYDYAASDATLTWWRNFAQAKYGCPVYVWEPNT